MKPKVLNRHIATAEEKRNAVYIGRGTKWGNPYVIGQDGDRSDVIRHYEVYLQASPHLMLEAKKELAGKDLLCSCAPRACHGDVLLRLANRTERK